MSTITSTDENDQATLVLRAQQGDLEAFTALYQGHLDRVYNFVFQMVRSHHDAADITSDVFLKAMEQLSSLREPTAFRGWLTAIARNTALTSLKKRKRSVGMDDEALDRLSDPSENVIELAADNDDETEKFRQLVWEAAATLNPADSSIFDLTVRQGMSSAEVAEVLDIKPAHAYVLVSRLKTSFGEALGATVLVKTGQQECPALKAVVTKLGNDRSTVMRKRVRRHARDCETCTTSRSRIGSVSSLFAGITAIAPSAAFAAELIASIEAAWPTRGPHMNPYKAGRKLKTRTKIAGFLAILILLLGIWIAVESAQRNDPDVKKILPSSTTRLATTTSTSVVATSEVPPPGSSIAPPREKAPSTTLGATNETTATTAAANTSSSSTSVVPTTTMTTTTTSTSASTTTTTPGKKPPKNITTTTIPIIG